MGIWTLRETRGDHRRGRLCPRRRCAQPCQAVTSLSAASVTLLMRSDETYTEYISARKPWISRAVMPRA